MEYDRRINRSCNAFSQLFVARSSSICRLVEGMIETRDRCKLVTFNDLQDLLENELPKFDSIPYDFANQSEKQMNFFRFKREFFRNRKDEVDPLIVWTNIRSFIKGSIEATESEKGFISMEQYFGFHYVKLKLNYQTIHMMNQKLMIFSCPLRTKLRFPCFFSSVWKASYYCEKKKAL